MYGSVTISNPNSAFYNWMFEVKHDEEAGETCLAYFFNTTSGATSSSDPTTDYEALLLTDQTLYISVEGVEDHNRFILNGVDGNNCDETNCVNTNVGVTPSPTPSPSPPGERHALNVAVCRLCYQRVGSLNMTICRNVTCHHS